MTTTDYNTQLHEKITQITLAMAEFNAPDLQVFASPPEHYRMRAEFKIWQNDDTAHYAMYAPGPVKKSVVLQQFPAASATINRLMPQVLAGINAQPLLRKKLFEAHYLTSTTGQALLSLLYHKPLDAHWQTAAETLRQNLNIHIVGRSRGQKIILGDEFVEEIFTVNGQALRYRHSENSFTQPNGFVCQAMLTWAWQNTRNLGGDLLELYCGNGNFTLPLAQNFRQVLATEIAKGSTADALHNMAVNDVHNIRILRMSSEELTQALAQQRQFRRLKDLDLNAYQFSTVFVDPPRAGLDQDTLNFIQGFDNIMYISCNHHTLQDNLRQLHASHEVVAAALFDQFPFTPHIETGVLLKKRQFNNV